MQTGGPRSDPHTPAFNNTGAPWVTGCLGRPPSSNLSCEDNEPGPPSFPCQFRVRTLLPPSRGFECCTWSSSQNLPWQSPSPRTALTTSRQSRVVRLSVCRPRLDPATDPRLGPSRWLKPLLHLPGRYDLHLKTSATQNTRNSAR